MYTRAEHCTVFLDKAALTSCKLVRCCWPKKQDDKLSTLGEVSPWLVWAKESIMYVQSDRSHKPCQPSIICHGTAHAAADQGEPDCKSCSETQSNHLFPLSNKVHHPCREHLHKLLLQQAPLGSGERILTAASSQGTPALLFHFRNYQMPQPNHVKLRLKLP